MSVRARERHLQKFGAIQPFVIQQQHHATIQKLHHLLFMIYQNKKKNQLFQNTIQFFKRSGMCVPIQSVSLFESRYSWKEERSGQLLSGDKGFASWENDNSHVAMPSGRRRLLSALTQRLHSQFIPWLFRRSAGPPALSPGHVTTNTGDGAAFFGGTNEGPHLLGNKQTDCGLTYGNKHAASLTNGSSLPTVWSQKENSGVLQHKHDFPVF